MKKFRKILSLFLVLILIASCQVKNEDKKETLKEDENLEKKEVNIVALKGPTAVGLSKFMKDVDDKKIEDNDYKFEVVASPEEVVAKISKNEVDLACIPSNLASILYNKTEGNIQNLMINTLGVLYIVENGDQITSLNELEGRTLYASGKSASPEYALKYILDKNNITNVNIEWKENHEECLKSLLSDEKGLALLAQPFLTIAQSKNENIKPVVDLTEEWDKIEKDSPSPSTLVMGVLVGKKDFVEKNPEVIDQVLAEYKKSVDYVNENQEDAGKILESYDIFPQKVIEKAISHMNIVYIDGEEMKTKLSGYLKTLFDQDPKAVGGKLPLDDFYYER